MILHNTQTALGLNTLDSLPPFVVEIKGIKGVFYSLAQDKQILTCMVERESLAAELEHYDATISSLVKVIDGYNEALLTKTEMLHTTTESLDAAFFQTIILQEQLTMLEDLNKGLSRSLELEKKSKRKAIVGLSTVGGIAVVGVLTGLLIKLFSK